MQISRYTPWVVAFAEGFTTLAVEVIAIRLAIPVVGSSITLTGVMLGVVLFALSAGYWRGGALSAKWTRDETRGGLTRNLLIATALYGAVSFPFEAFAIEKLLDFGLNLPLSIGVAASVLFLLPIYLASQTVPMLAELTNVDGKAGKASGKVLFFSTVGSVAGGIVTPVVLFPWIGVTHSTWVICALLAGAACLASADRLGRLRTAGLGALALVAAISVSALLASTATLYAFDSAYQTIRIVDTKNPNGRSERVLFMGGGRASGVWSDTGQTSFDYILAAERKVAETPARRILVIGAAGFTFPRDVSTIASVNQIDAVDVDPVVKRIAEQQFLRAPLPPKVHFVPQSARYAARRFVREKRRYDLAFVDAYFGKGIPVELVTTEFFRDVCALSDQVAINAIMDRDVESAFALNLLASVREACGGVWMEDVNPGDSYMTNMLLTTWPAKGSEKWNGNGTVYRDDRNTADHDHVLMVW